MDLAPASTRPPLQLGSYKPLVTLATGGMATLYVARKVGAAGFERLVALKRVHPHLLANADFYAMFRDEARVCSVIRHPNVVPLTDVVDAEGELFLVLDYVESLSLTELLRAARDAGTPLAPPIVSRIMADALAGLAAAHEAVDLRGQKLEVIHRDVSPQNIIVGTDGTSRLIDFGIAKAASRISATGSGVLKGKLHYMSPEQIGQKTLDQRSDIFAAGVVLFEALTGERLVSGADEGDVALALMLGSFPSASSVAPGLTPAVDAVVAKALARDRDERYQRASDLEVALQEALPPATARTVGQVVETVGAAILKTRRDDLRHAIELADRGAPGPVSPSEPTLPGPAEATATTVVTPVEEGAGTRRRWTFVALTAGVAAVAGGAFVFARPDAAQTGTKSAPSGNAAAAPSAVIASNEVAAPKAVVSGVVGAPLAEIAPPPSSGPAPTASAAPSGSATTAPPPKRNDPRPAPDLRRKNPYGR